jgi:cytochrome c oxidase subunit 4
MKDNEVHKSSFASLAIVLVTLLTLTTISVSMAALHLGALSVAIALIIAGIKVRTVITYFMHIKFEKLFLKLMVTGVFVLYGLVIIITFIDYAFR